MTRRSLALALLCAAPAACTRGSRPAPLRLGTTTTVEQSGALALLDSLHPPNPLRVIVAASGTILQSAAAGDLDVVITHAPSLEQRLLVEPGHAALRCPFVASRFAIVGPAADPAHAAQASTAADAFGRIARAHSLFVSRGDSSGTHVKELSLWKAAGVALPAPSRDGWYVQSGGDQALTVRIADDRHGYALADLPTFAHLKGIELHVLLSADTALANPYTLYVTRAAQNTGATEFSTWALGGWRTRLLALRLTDGTPAFAPVPGGCTVPVATAETADR